MLLAQVAKIPVTNFDGNCGYCFREVYVVNNMLNCFIEVGPKHKSFELFIDVTIFHDSCYIHKLNTLKKFGVELEELNLEDLVIMSEEIKDYNKEEYKKLMQKIKSTNINKLITGNYV